MSVIMKSFECSCWNIWRTSQAPFWSHCSFLTRPTLSCATSTIQGHLQGLGRLWWEESYAAPDPPQGCVLSPLLFFIYRNNCTSTDPSIKFLNDDPTVITLIQYSDESANRQEVDRLVHRSSQNHLELHLLKMTGDFRRTSHYPTTLSTVDHFQFLVPIFHFLRNQDGPHASTPSERRSCIDFCWSSTKLSSYSLPWVSVWFGSSTVQ